MTDQERLRIVQHLLGQEYDDDVAAPGEPPAPKVSRLPVQEPDVTPPPAGDPYRLQSEDYQRRASQIEDQAKPAGPQTKGQKILGALQAGLEGFSGGYTRGPGYFEHQQARDEAERQRQQDLYTRAKA